jgi:hypothetical protein
MKAALVLMTAILTSVAASAQEPPPQQPPPQPPGVTDNMRPGEIQRLFDAYLMMEAQRFLDLSDQQYPQFVARLRTLQETRVRNTQARVQLMGDLQRLSNPRLIAKPDEAQLKERLNALQELESRNAAEMRKAYNGLDEVLNLQQQARFRVFEEEIERRKIELLMRARQQQQPVRPNLPPAKQRPLKPPPGIE